MTVVERIQEKFKATTVYGEPVEVDGVVVVPGARVIGGGGGGSDDKGAEGGGFGLFATPAGAWVVDHKGARWKPAIDAVWIIGGGYLVAIAYFYYTWRIERAKAKGNR